MTGWIIVLFKEILKRMCLLYKLITIFQQSRKMQNKSGNNHHSEIISVRTSDVHISRCQEKDYHWHIIAMSRLGRNK